jgi:aryl-alcohol dehydrogenase-like predicted oxidoreductase
MAHLEEAVTAVNIKLSSTDIAYLEDPYQPHPILGHGQV